MLTNELAETISLTGAWEFRLGDDAPWSTLDVPGCWEGQGYSKYPEGPATYRRQVTIPAAWRGRRIQVEFQAVSYACQVFLNGKLAGEHIGLWTPFQVDLSEIARPGETNRLELVIYKPGERYPMRGSLAGLLPDVATTFGGVWQEARVAAYKVALEDLQITPFYEAGRAGVSGTTRSWGKKIVGARWEVTVECQGLEVAHLEWPYKTGKRQEFELGFPGRQLWSPQEPALYTITVSLSFASLALSHASEFLTPETFHEGHAATMACFPVADRAGSPSSTRNSDKPGHSLTRRSSCSLVR